MESKQPDELKEGDWILVRLPCRVKVSHVESMDGGPFTPDRIVHYTEGQLLFRSGSYGVGSALSVVMSLDQGGGIEFTPTA